MKKEVRIFLLAVLLSMGVSSTCLAQISTSDIVIGGISYRCTMDYVKGIYGMLLLAAFVLALPQTFAKNCSPVLPHSGLKFGTVRDAKL